MRLLGGDNMVMSEENKKRSRERMKKLWAEKRDKMGRPLKVKLDNICDD